MNRLSRSSPLRSRAFTAGRAARALLVLSLLLPAVSSATGYAEDGWEPLADGIAYREFALPGPNRAYVSRLDRANPNVIVDSGIALGQIGAGKETVS